MVVAGEYSERPRVVATAKETFTTLFAKLSRFSLSSRCKRKLDGQKTPCSALYNTSRCLVCNEYLLLHTRRLSDMYFISITINTYNPEVTVVTWCNANILYSEKQSRNESLFISSTRGCYIYTVLGGVAVTLGEQWRGIRVGC